MPEVQEHILSTLAYFDNFRYPLTAAEILSFLPHASTEGELKNHLAELLYTGAVFRVQEYYSLSNDEYVARRRNEGYLHAMPMIRTAQKIAGLLSAFPFVRGVAISGSLSKYYADEQSDIDFFIITAGNRLWLARSFTHVAKKISFLFNRQHLFCMNYYIDEYQPEIEEHNLFTATEVVTLIPVNGMPAFILFNQANSWTRSFLPNHALPAIPVALPQRNLLARGIEKLLHNAVGDWLDTQLMHLTSKRWNAKKHAGKRNETGMLMGMRCGKHYSKPDPGLFQEKIICNYRRRAREIIESVRARQLAASAGTAAPYNS